MTNPNNTLTASKVELIRKELHKMIDAIPRGTAKAIYRNQTLYLCEADESLHLLPCYDKDSPVWEAGDLSSTIHEDDKPLFRNVIEAQCANHEEINVTYRIVGPDVTIRCFYLSGRFDGLSDGLPTYDCSLMDITSQRSFFDMVELENDRYRSFLHLSNDIIMEHDLLSDVAKFTDNYTRFFSGNSTIERFSEYLSRTYDMASILYEAFNQSLLQPRQGASLEWECPLKVRSGESQWFRITPKSLFNGGRHTTTVCKLTHIHHERQERAKLLEEAGCDPVTGLFDANKMHAKVEEILESKPSTLYLMGVVDFEKYSDIVERYGDLYADMILQDYAKQFQRTFPQDCLLGVVCKGRFLFFLPCENPATQSASLDDSLLLATRQMSLKYLNEDLSFRVGYCAYPDHGCAFDPLLIKATHSLYAAKNDQAPSRFYSDAVRSSLEDKENELLPFSRRHEDPKQFHKLFRRDMTLYAFETLSSTEDTISAVRTILERLSEQMDVQCFHIIEHVSVLDQDLPHVDFGVLSSFAATFHWDSQYKLLSLGAKKIIHYPFAEMMEEFGDENRLISIEDCHKLKKRAPYNKLFNWIQTKALLGCGIYHKSELSFGICLYDKNRKRAWSEYDKRSLRIVTKLISSFMTVYHSNQLAKIKIDRLLNYDQLTGLYTKDMFLEAGKKLLAESKGKNLSFALTYSDICNFKFLNDSYGYEAGDAVLKEFGNLIKHPPSQGVACRIHSDHFVSLVALSSSDGLTEQIAKVNHEFSQRIEAKHPSSNLVLTSGVYQFKDTDHNLTEALDNANIARKEAKKLPKIGYKVYDDVLSRRQLRIGEIEACMHQALSNNEFKVYVQPKYDITNNRIIGGEALVRWIRPDGTMYYPDDFIPLFEQNGFIEEMDFFVLEKICEKLNEYKQSGKKAVPISVNQSRYLLNNPEYVYRVKCVIDKYDIPPEWIELELTETMVMQNIDSVIEVLYQLKAISVKLSIDDFGSGYSSLNLLKRLPVDVIKIDRTFLDESVQSEPTRIIIESLVLLAKRLGICPICEGIETKEQADFLRSISCNYVQGYLFAKPMPILEYDKIINNL